MQPLRSATPRYEYEYFGVGLYTAGDAARLLGRTNGKGSTQSIRRWLDGYKYQYRGKLRRAKPLWAPELPKIRGKLGLGFRDLMELRFVASFREEGLSLQAIRLA